MVARNFWISLIESAWKERSIVWLSGVRRVGKTWLCRSLLDVEYLDCELPGVRHRLEDPEAFLSDAGPGRLVLDEVHRLQNPSQLLKIAADYYPDTKILATGSSTLGATAKFSDTLTGRKRDIRLTPMITAELENFGKADLPHRLLRGGLPPLFLAEDYPAHDYQEWLDAYWARDIQELFRIQRRSAFVRFVELLLSRSGGIFEASEYARLCEVSRPTITNYLDVLEATSVAHVVRPFSRRASTEIVSAPRVYGFDTGFVAFFRGWTSLRREDLGYLWEHLVLNEIAGALQIPRMHYWRNKRGLEVDFVMARRGAEPAAIECKWSAEAFDPSGIRSFRRLHPGGDNFVVARNVAGSYTREFAGHRVRFVSLDGLIEALRALCP